MNMGAMASRALKIGLAAAVALVAVPPGWAIHYLASSDSVRLLSCMSDETPPLAWACRQVLYALHPAPEEVKTPTTQAATVRAAALQDTQEARRLLRHFMDAGVDLNAADENNPTRWTALHSAAKAPNLRAVRLLIEAGANPDVRDGAGRTPADLARFMSEKYKGNEAEYAEVIRLIEEQRFARGKGPSS
ncbi:ankyrin repeat domain-containing protein [Aquabacterium sp. A7-Y]|uniref:ankyrin repeat domain-containing protein n=1 Tax=Aquabacterium sp. A7-Y TaxID=1349605 RepID=UPI00223DCEFD|nr:ankyrin repeat domain-containing protein [Aquabacterium sp. A7-Y]MCW7537594.1 ankyrin repeat domain-containing protein [Aquabacterium sp. A7-Y]